MKNNERIKFSVHRSRPKALKRNDSDDDNDDDDDDDDDRNNKKKRKIIIRTVFVGRKKHQWFMFKAI
jgi:hypothetical protein